MPLGVEKDTLQTQAYFWAQGDIMFTNLDAAGRKAFCDRIESELLYALDHDNTFRDGSILEGAILNCAQTLKEERDAR